MAAAADDPAGDPVARLGLDPGRQPLVGGAHLGDLLAFGERVRERVDPRLAQPLQLLPPVGEDVGFERSVGVSVGARLERAYESASR